MGMRRNKPSPPTDLNLVDVPTGEGLTPLEFKGKKRKLRKRRDKETDAKGRRYR